MFSYQLSSTDAIRSTYDDRNVTRMQNIRDNFNAIKGASAQFVEDMNIVLQKFRKNIYVLTVLNEFVSKMLGTRIFFVSYFIVCAKPASTLP